MWVRANHASGVSDIDAAVKALGEKVLPVCREQKGFKGITASANRATGALGVLTFWETREDLEASESALAKQRAETMAEAGGTVTVQVLEEVGGAVSAPPSLGTSRVMVRSIKMDPSKVDEQLAHFNDVVLPDMKGLPGFQMCRLMIDRKTGAGTAGVVVADADSASAIASHDAEMREGARAQGVELGEVDVRELVFSHMQ